MRKHFLLGLAATLLPWNAWAADELTVTIKNAEHKVEYNGANTKSALQIEVYAGETKLKEGTNYKLKYSEEPTKVGSYSVEAIGIDDTYLGQTGTETFSVTPKVVTTLTLAEGNLTREYDGTATDNIDLSEFVSTTQLVVDTEDEKADFLKCLTLKRTEGEGLTDVGSTIRVEISAASDTQGSNYKYDANGRTENVPLIITPKALTVTLNPVTYKGEEYELDDFKIEAGQMDSWDKGEVEGLIDSDKSDFTLEFEASEDVKDVKTYTLTATLNSGNYTVEDVKLEVEPAELTITINDAKKSLLNGYYGYNNPIDVTGAFTITEFKGEETAESLGLTLKRAENGKTEDGIEKVGECLVSLYNGENVVTFTEKEGEEEGYNTAVVGNYEISYTPTYYHLMKKGFAAAGFTYEINEEADLTYQGKEFEAPEDLLTITYNAPTGDMDLTYGVDYTLEVKPVDPATTVKNAGDKFDIYVKAINEETCNFRDATAGGYKISQASGEELEVKKGELKITPKSGAVFSKIVDGNRSGDLSGLFDFDGLKDVDENGEATTKSVLTMEVRETAVGTYPVKVYDESGKVVGRNAYQTTGLKNYLIVEYDIKDDMYEILADGLVLDGDVEDEELAERIAAYNGKEVSQVTVKNLKNFIDAETNIGDHYTIEAEKWYTLVLPFDIRVSEISKNFGYAIVNIPNTDNSDADDVRFKLTMQTVPANTLMAFKVDEDMDWENKEVTFETVTIVAPTGDYSVENGNKDKAGNEFRPVYEKTVLTSADDWFLRPSNGVFYNPVDSEVGEFNVYPLNGYIHFASPATGAARTISMENPDGSTTAINAVTGKVVSNNAEGWYTIGGLKLNGEPTEKGIYINNGKKVVIK